MYQIAKILSSHIGRCLQRFYISSSCVSSRAFTIKDHYDFDQKVVNSDNPVIVNFHAEWCDPCKILTPKMTELLTDSTEIDLAVIDVDTNLDLVETFEVKAVPAVLAFRNGVVVDKFIGLVDANMIEDLINKLKKKFQFWMMMDSSCQKALQFCNISATSMLLLCPYAFCPSNASILTP